MPLLHGMVLTFYIMFVGYFVLWLTTPKWVSVRYEAGYSEHVEALYEKTSKQ